ncbi:Ni-dependent carbon monoxide dehydrogenase precursor [Desulfitobacterium sp. LBE]|uniref:Carbon monoxide dehydrogenase n=2 Tax=Desulfitobacterium hafniense TaxID=49338 RepID=A0A098BA03_DESHA|nr:MULTISPECIES: anaerobic carbon-monoxide dehydrogenase catalytic subunit [Desulfitobacterium]EHL08883.1 carbon-monoxide dehydrogenase, catalytic subunit [Desulfitobacterium hafniense DP7]TWH58204.1 Ni-dependent carbon monoxide dehydrogenase precursor [Desulfitobacterium sp. LBE]CDX04701.1 Carbon monoxide dehydrogenase 2 [Desulfitobacterium hafniense]
MLNVRSIDPAAQDLLKKAHRDGIETVWDRYDKQQPQCGFGSLGVCCRHCIQGPCRIDPFGQGPDKGICGATADVIVARNLLRQVAAGAAAHVDHAYDAVEALELAAQGKIDYPIADAGKLKAVASGLGIDSEGKEPGALALEVVRVAYGDMGNHHNRPMKWVSAHAPKQRLEVWESLGIIPRNPDREIREAMHQTTMGMDADPVNLLLATAKQGLVDGYAGLKLATDMQDILFGTPAPVVTEANLGVLKEDYVNLIVHGHVPLLSEKIVQWAKTLSPEAEAVGAKGVQVAGICCTGNEVLMRQGVPLATNYLAQELAIVTGAVDAMVVDVQCIMPSLSQISSCYHTELITTMPIVKIPGATHVPFALEKADEAAQEIVRKAIGAYARRDPNKVHIPDYRAKIIAGFSVEAIAGALGKLDPVQPLKPLADNIVNGNIVGVVATVGCNNVKVTQDIFHVEMVKELLKNNVLVVATGCSAHALAKAGMMNSEGTERYAGNTLKAVLRAIGEAAGLGAPLPPVLHMGSCVDNSRIGDLVTALANYLGVDSAALPVAASAPEPQHEKALSIGTWAVAMGITTHLGVIPPVLGSKQVTELLTVGLTEVIGGKFYVETEPQKAALGLIEDIRKKRQALGLDQ